MVRERHIYGGYTFIIIFIIIISENPQLVVQLPPQSTTHKTLGVMI